METTATSAGDGGEPPREIRLAVAMNGGVSLAVWIGGVSYELARASEKGAEWGPVLGDRTLTIDVLAGTSAGGINAAFLALHQCYGADLLPLRDMWLDHAGLEPGPGAAPDEKHLLRPPEKGVPSLLDGELFFKRLEDAFLDLLKGVDEEVPRPDPKPVDLRLTTTSFEGVPEPLSDDLGSDLHERSHRASFHYVVEDHPGGACSLRFAPGHHAALARRLARASRSTASYPFAFEPSRAAGPTEMNGLDGSAEVDHHLLDGGVLNNLPLDHAIEAIFARHASEQPERWLVAVVPDPAEPGHRQDSASAPALADIVMASLMGIPRNQTVGAFVDDVRKQNASVAGRREARRRLLDLDPASLDTAAGALYESYKESRRTALAAELAARIGAPGHTDVLDAITTDPPPHFPPTWPAGEACWEGAVLLRHVTLLLQLHTEAGGSPKLRSEIHRIREAASDLSHLAARTPPPEADWRVALRRELDTWPERAGASPDEIRRARTGLRHVLDDAAKVLVDLATGWTPNGALPPALAGISSGTPEPGRVSRARDVLNAVEVLQSAFSTFEEHPEQQVLLGFLTPRKAAVLDGERHRDTAAAKLAGEQLGHFGAFLKRSWRANDWMWGRLDASTFLFELLERHGTRISNEAKLDVQKKIVEEEAPAICAAVVCDRKAGAVSRHGEELVRGASEDDLLPARCWRDLVTALDLPDEGAHQAFLTGCRLGEEDVSGELWSSLTARLGTRAGATTLTVLRRAEVPVVDGALNTALAPVRMIMVVADRYAAALRPRQAGTRDAAWLARLATVALGALAAANVLGIDMGSAAPFVWLGFAGVLLTLALVAPVTTVLTVALVCGVGVLTAVPGTWAPEWLERFMPLNRAVAIVVITLLLTVISSRRVHSADARLRRIVRRSDQTVEALDEATR